MPAWHSDDARRLARVVALVDIAVALVLLTKVALSPAVVPAVVGVVLLVAFAPLARFGRGTRPGPPLEE